MAETLAERVRLRLKEEMTRRHLSQRDIAGLLNTDQPRISRLLSGDQEMRVQDLAELCFAVGIQPSEAVRDHGLEFCAEMTPTELRVLEQYRKQTDAMKSAITEILQVRVKGAVPQRYAGSKPTAYKVGKPRGHSSGA